MPEEAEGISECKWVRLDVAHDRISYDNAAQVVKVAQRVVFGLEGGPEEADAAMDGRRLFSA